MTCDSLPAESRASKPDWVVMAMSAKQPFPLRKKFDQSLSMS